MITNDMIMKRMQRIGSKKNFVLESQEKEMKENNQLVIINKRTDGGMTTVDLILEPNKFDELSSTTRLSFDEFVDAMNQIVDEEEDDWDSLRMKDQINITRDKILEATIIKYAKEKGLDISKFNGKDVNYLKRYDREGHFIGEAIIVTLTAIQ